MTEIYYLARDGDGVVQFTSHSEDAALDYKAKNPEYDILPVVDLNEFADHTIQTEDGAKAVIKRIENSLNAGGSGE